MIKAIVGANWGDEGKGKITDLCAMESDIVVRFQGGSNAGHTIINEKGKFALHQLPSGIFYEDVVNVISNGFALNIEYLLNELENIKSSGINPNLIISDKAQILMPHHVQMDIFEEDRLADKKFGSTKSGIAPFYSDKYSKFGIQVCELYYDDLLKEKLQQIYEKVNIIFTYLYHKEKINWKNIFELLKSHRNSLEKYVTNTTTFLRSAIKQNKNILLEGQLGALRDIEMGIYPYVTSSSTLAGNAAIGASIPPYEIKNILAVTKAYSTSVGEGPFVSEIFGEKANELRKRGGDSGEYGATTGRPRRVGYFDLVASKYGINIQCANEIAITCLDVLSYLDEIPICIAYNIDGNITTEFQNTYLLKKAKPVIKKLKGWKSDISNIKKFSSLPIEAQNYINFIEKELNVKVSMISNGPSRNEIIYKKD